MSPAPPLTIGIPAYNAAATLPHTLDSIIAQDFADFTVIVSDNCSSDATPDILAEYAQRDPRIHIYRQPKNIGGAGNFSALPRLAATPFFKWQSADDLIAPDYVRKCFYELQEHPDTVLTFGDTMMIDAEGRFLRKHDDNLHLIQDTPAQRVAAFVRQQWLCNAQFGVTRTQQLLRTSLIAPYPSSDLTMLAQLCALGKFRHVPGAHFFRRFSPDSMGLGDLTEDQKAAWFATDHVEANPQWRVFCETNAGLWKNGTPLPERMQTILSYDAHRVRKAFGRWRYQQKVRAGKIKPIGWDTLFKNFQPDTGSLPTVPGTRSNQPATHPTGSTKRI